MKELLSMKKSSLKNKNSLNQNLKIIKKLKDYEDKEKVALLLNEFNKKQEEDYFLTQKNIKFGNITTNIQKGIPFTLNLLSPRKNNFQNQRRQFVLTENSNNSYSNVPNHIKRSTSLSSRKVTRLITNIDTSNNLKKIVIDNIELKKHFNDIRKRINNYNSKKHNKMLQTEVPLKIRKNLFKQEKLFTKIMKEQINKEKNEENIKRKINRDNINDLLINRSSEYNKKSLEYTILDKNLKKENKYRNNYWNITLRNNSCGGKFEKLGYYNVGNKFEPLYTFFNLNRNIEYFTNPMKVKTDDGKQSFYKKNISINLDDNLYNSKTRQNLKYLNHIKNLEINGKNLLDLEEEREKKIKGNKILHKNEYLEHLYNKKFNKTKFSDGIYEDEIYAKNYNELDFMKNKNLNLKLY